MKSGIPKAIIVGLVLASTLGMTVFASPVAALEGQKVRIDIKPYSCPNTINLKSNGEVPVAILDNKYFDVSTVDPSTVVFAGASATKWNWGDANGDGNDDLWFHFVTSDLDLDKDSKRGYLIGETYGGDPFWGVNRIKIVGA